MTKAMQKMSMSRGKPSSAAELTRRPAGQVQDLSGQNRLIRQNGASGTLLRVVVTVAFVMLFGCGSSGDQPSPALIGDQPSPTLIGGGAPASDWMATISDTKPISLLGIPGTHDTGTGNRPDLAYLQWIVTQDRGILDQLYHGIRFLDIRGRLIGNGLAIHHGEVFLNLFFQDVIDACKQFLQAHPTETILLNLVHEHTDADSTLSYHQVFLNYYNNNRYLDDTHTRELWYLGTTIPTLGQVRGKIVLMRTFALDHPGDALGIDVPGGQNSAFYTSQFSTNPEQTLYIENLWKPADCDNAYAEKQYAVARNIQRAELDHRSSNHLYMTYTSGTGGELSCWKPPRDFANNINPWFLQIVLAKWGPVGIVIMDFPGDDIIARIIDSNKS